MRLFEHLTQMFLQRLALNQQRQQILHAPNNMTDDACIIYLAPINIDIIAKDRASFNAAIRHLMNGLLFICASFPEHVVSQFICMN